MNAGSCEYLDFPDPDWSAVRRVMEVNFFGTVNCVEFVLPLLRAGHGRRPHLVVVASQVTAAPFPRAEAYGASKAALQYFCDSLRLDLAHEQIDVSVINPGFVDTPLTRKNDFEMPFSDGCRTSRAADNCEAGIQASALQLSTAPVIVAESVQTGAPVLAEIRCASAKRSRAQESPGNRS